MRYYTKFSFNAQHILKESVFMSCHKWSSFCILFAVHSGNNRKMQFTVCVFFFHIVHHLHFFHFSISHVRTLFSRQKPFFIHIPMVANNGINIWHQTVFFNSCSFFSIYCCWRALLSLLQIEINLCLAFLLHLRSCQRNN